MDGTAAWMIIVWRFGENSPGSNLPPPSMNANGQRGSLSTGSVRILFYFPFISEDDLGKITTPLLFDLLHAAWSRENEQTIDATVVKQDFSHERRTVFLLVRT
jgi:hypothetical protein